MTGRVKKPVASKKKKTNNGYKMPAPISVGEIITDGIAMKQWLLGPSIGMGGFGEIYSACEHTDSPKKIIRYPYVIKIEPHENGPLFVEKHFYIRNVNKEVITKYMKTKKLSSLGIPSYYGNGSHEYQGQKYRYLVLERYGKDVWSLFKEANRVFSVNTAFQLGLQMLDVLEYIHSRGYVHADIKGANILMGLKKGTENQAYLVDFGLATKVNDKEFKPDPKSAHNGTIEYTSRDAHLGVPTMRGDLEILGYNMLQWIVGELPWEKHMKQPKVVQEMKEAFMRNVRKEILEKFISVPETLIQYFEYINSIKPKDSVDYTRCKMMFKSYLKSEGISQSSKIDFTGYKKQKTNKPNKSRILTDSEEKTENGAVKSVKQEIKSNVVSEEDCENEEPKQFIKKVPSKNKKRKSLEPSVVVKVKKTKIAPKETPKATPREKRHAKRKPTSKVTPLATPPTKENHTNTATQKSIEKPQPVSRQVSFDIPNSKIIHKKVNLKRKTSLNDIFEETMDIEEKKVKPRKRLLSEEKVTVTKRVLRKRTTTKS